MVVFFKHEHNYYKIETESLFGVDDINETNAMNCDPVVVPEEHLFPQYVDGFKVVPVNDDTAHYVKWPTLSWYTPKDPYAVSTQFLQEVQNMEALSKSPHVNIVEYKGCVVEKQRIRGVCMEQCVETLYDRMESNRPIIKENVIQDIRKAVMHMHHLGYCHNDISLWNIMFRNDDSVVIIDFDACFPIGQRLGKKRGSPGFADKTATISSPTNDFYSIARVEEYLVNGALPEDSRAYRDKRDN